MSETVDAAPSARSDSATTARTLRLLWPYVWQHRLRVSLALVLLVIAKLATLGVPLILKRLVDTLDLPPTPLVMIGLLVLAYGALRLVGALFQELRQVVFARVMARTARQVTLQVFEHLHSLSLRFHLDRKTGAVSRDLGRGMTSVADLLDWTIYTIVPTILEVLLVTLFLVIAYDWGFAVITLSTLAAYIVFTFVVTEWRLRYYRAANEADTQANARAVDSLLNSELKRYDGSLVDLENATVKSLKTLAVLNVGQSGIVAVGLTLLLWRAAQGVAAGVLTLGDLVLVNAFLIQLAAPLNYLGMMYREVKQALTNIERMFEMMHEHRDIDDREAAPSLAIAGARVEFDRVRFGYDPRREILHEISFTIPAGRTLAVVGATGSGKSTLARLLYRFFDVNQGAIRIDGQDNRGISQQSLRAAIGIVPQDTVLFNESIGYNIGYGQPDAGQADIETAARAAHIHSFIAAQPDGYGTAVGERGLKLSGGEKQRVAIARTLLAPRW